MRLQKLLLLVTILLTIGTLAIPAGVPPAREVNVATIEGVIDPAMADYLTRALEQAQANHAETLIIRLNTPGGLGTSMDKITGLLLNSSVPTVVYVSPRGAKAFSAGTFITLAANFAVMHPDSTIGAAHPVQLGGTPAPGSAPSSPNAESQIMTEKLTNAYAKDLRTIAQARGRNADWAEQAVRKSVTATASEALKLKIVDSLQPSLGSLLQWLDGRTTEVEGRTVTLHTRGARVVEIPPTIKDRFLHQLADPNLLLILMAIASMGILFELQNPGSIFPGVVGGIALLLALYSMSVLPVTTTGLVLIAFGILLFILDVKLPSHGVLTIGGVAAFMIGGLMLIDTNYSGVVKMSWQVVTTVAVLLALFFAVAVGAAVRAHLRQPTTGREGLIGAQGKVSTTVSEETEGEIAVVGELWRARSQQGELAPGTKVEVLAVEGLTLVVRPVARN